MSLKEILKRVEEAKTAFSKMQHRVHIKLFTTIGECNGDIYLNGKGEMKIEIGPNKCFLDIHKVKEIIEKLSIYVTEVESGVPDKPDKPNPDLF